MPNVVGKQEVAAKLELKKDGLIVGQSRYETSHKPKGTVISTSPGSGISIVKGDSVSLLVSEGITTTPETVQSVVGDGVSTAENTLTAEKLSFKLDYTSVPPSGVNNPAPNIVLLQQPIAGTKVQSGQTVILTVLAPNSKYPLADVDGDTIAAAAARLTSAGLTISPKQTSLCSNTLAPNLVIATDPPEGSLVTANQSITLEVSSGVCNEVVPNVINDTEAAATTALTGQGFVPSYSLSATPCEPGAPQTVVSQNDSPGSSVPYGSTVGLAVCVTTAPTTTTTTTVPPTS
jgi:serine/threonine-protein kinase